MSSDSMNRAYKTVQERRDTAEILAQKRQSEIAERIPEARPLLLCISQTGSRIARILLAGGEQVRERMEQAARENLDAQARLNDLLLQEGYPADYLDMPYTCKQCGDTGYVDGQRCSCLLELSAQYEAADFNASAHIAPQSFDTFSLKYYEGAARSTMGEILNSCRAYAEQFQPHSPSLLMMGDTGLGKTHLSLAIAARVMERGYSAMYASSPDLFRKLQNEYYGKGEPGADTMEALISAQLIILDDLGSEIANQFNTSALYNIVNSRLNANRPTIINTNLTPKELEGRYGARIASRLMTMYKCFWFTGRDVRQQKLQNNEL